MTVEEAPTETPKATADDWFQRAVVYQIYPRSFADSNGDGIGDLRGIIGRLDYLHRLGVDVVWLSPIYTSPQDDNGYDISDYRNVDPLFGTLDELRELTDGLHARGMKLVMDLVVNHTSDEHPWFVESRSSVDNAKRDWYWWRPARPGTEPGAPGAEPTNWQSYFSGSVWELDPATGEYYLHLFSRKQPDLNWENPQVRAAVYEMMRWWLDRGIDGFRMDVINMLSKHADLPDGPVAEGSQYGDGSPYFISGPRIHEFIAEMHREVLGGFGGRLLTVGETPAATVEQARLFTDAARGELDMVFQFEHVGLDQRAGKWDRVPIALPRLTGSFVRWQQGLADVGWNSLYWGNHDQPRAVSRFGDDGEARVVSATALATALHMQRGTPFVYQGEELGMTNVPFASIADFRDIESLRHYAAAVDAGADPDVVLEVVRVASRDNARTPMQWDASAHAGFTTGEPWIMVNPNHTTINAAAARADPDSVFHHYRRLIALRRELPVIATGDFTMLLEDDERVYAFTRSLDGVELLVLGNFTGDALDVDLQGWEDAESLIGEAGLSLGPWEGRVLRRK